MVFDPRTQLRPGIRAQAEDSLGIWTQWCIPVLALVLFLVRLSGPSSLMDKDQERPAAYVLDILQNGHWLCPRDWTGDIASKPPMSVWLSALISRAVGGVSICTLVLPGGLGVAGAATLIFYWGRRVWGARAGLLAALTLLLSPLPLKLIALNRTDGLFTLTVAATAATAFRAWERGSGWPWFWLAGAVATLTKGPLGLLLGGLGLLAELWERRSGSARPMRPFVGWGLPLYLAVTAGWLGAAMFEAGTPVLRKMLGSELAGHALDPSFGLWGRGLWLAPGYFVSRFAPWSLVAVAMVVRAVTTPSAEDSSRRLERFLVVWLLGGLAVLALATHQRGDLVAPLLPPAALLAGRQLAQWSRLLRPRTLWTVVAAVSVAGLCATAVGYQMAGRSEVVRRSEGMRELAASLRDRLARSGPLVVVDAPFALQTHLGQFRTPISYAAAARRLQTDPSALVAVRDLGRLQASLPASAASALVRVAAWPAAGDPWVQVVTLSGAGVAERRLAAARPSELPGIPEGD